MDRTLVADIHQMGACEENPMCETTYASFRIVGTAFDPESASRALQLEPAITRVPTETQNIGVWGISSKDRLNSTSIQRHIEHLLAMLEPLRPDLEALAITHDLTFDFFCLWRSANGHGGPVFDADLLRRLASLNATLSIDFYG